MTAAVCTCTVPDALRGGPGIPPRFLPALEMQCTVHGVMELAVASMEAPAHFTGWRTPRDKFEDLHAEFAFNVDAAADDEDALIGQAHCKPGWVLGQDDVATDLCPVFRFPKAIIRDSAHAHCHLGRYYTEASNGLLAEHYQPGDRVFCNPPYTPTARLYEWVRLAATTAKLGILWVMVLPPSVDVAWFHEFLWDAELHRWRDRVEGRFPRGRWRFIGPDGKVSPPKGNLIAIFRPPLECAK